MTKETQNKLIAEHLKAGRKITPLDALYLFNCWRLSARIDDLKKLGMSIKTIMIKIRSDGKNKYIGRYELIKEEK
jgi:hypothetical protein